MAWIAPDDVLGRALQTLLSNEPLGDRVCLIRDNRGRVRVALERCEGKKTNAKNLDSLVKSHFPDFRPNDSAHLESRFWPIWGFLRESQP
jgi:hypothetical protein